MPSTEKTSSDNISPDPTSLSNGQHHWYRVHNGHHHTGRRFRHFFRPDGRKVHVAPSPDDAEKLKKTLSEANKDGNWDLVIHGSLEHVEALREAHASHEATRDDLRAKHGKTLDEFERVIRELDALVNELHMVSQHAVQLDANFSKYGYSAHLRTRDSPEVSAHSSTYGNHDSDHHSHRDWNVERNKGESMMFWKKPIIRQYFHKGLLWRAQEAQEVASYELFVDLFYVGIIDITGESASEHATAQSFLRFAITFLLGWKIWNDITLFSQWFDADDIVRRLTILFSMTCLLGFTTNIVESWEETYTPLISFYLASRLFCAFNYAWTAYLIPMVRAAMIGNCLINVFPAALWIISIHVHESGRQSLIWPAILLDYCGYTFLVFFERGGDWMGLRLSAWAKRTFEFFPGMNIKHRIERTGAFVSLVFGYSVIALLYQNHVHIGINSFFGKAVLGLIEAFSFNWLYFEIDSFNLHIHAIRRHFFTAILWNVAHVPFIMGFVLAGAALAKLVLAHDCPEAEAEWLYEVYALKSESEIPDGLRWFYCAGLAIALASTGIISLSQVYKTIPNQRLKKHSRLALRFAVALIILLLPLAHDKLNSLNLITITTCLVVLVLGCELVGSTCIRESFWLDRQRRCNYEARCGLSKWDLEESFKTGQVIEVEEVARREGERGGAVVNT